MLTVLEGSLKKKVLQKKNSKCVFPHKGPGKEENGPNSLCWGSSCEYWGTQGARAVLPLSARSHTPSVWEWSLLPPQAAFGFQYTYEDLEFFLNIIFLKRFIFYLCKSFLVYTCVHYLSACGGQKRVAGPLEWQVAISYYVGSWNWICILKKYSQPLSHVSNHFLNF